MRFCILVSSVCLLTSAGLAGLSGTYTIKPDGSGDFLSLQAAGEMLSDSGISGDCMFEIYGDTLSAAFHANGVAGSAYWTTTFLPGAGASPVLSGGLFWTQRFGRVRLRGLHFLRAPITANSSDGWRISGCRFTVDDYGLELSDCFGDTVDGNTFDMLPTGAGHGPAITVAGSDDVIFNNIVNCESAEVDGLIDLDLTRNVRVLFNTIRLSPIDINHCYCIWIDGSDNNSEVLNNVIVLARSAGSLDACVHFIWTQTPDSAVLDRNCYFVESLGSVGAWDTDDSLIKYDWDQWREFGFEANGINADPMLVGATNLHLRQGSPCIGGATPIPGIDFDIDGDPRDPEHPDIGADEFTGGAVEERPKPQASSHKLAATVVRQLPAGAVAFDASGRRVTNPKSGIYFVRAEPSAAGHEPSAVIVRKVILQR